MMNRKNFFAFLICTLLFCSGCLELQQYDSQTLDALIETTSALAVANTASTPVNPYAVPIGIGLSGIVGILEALRRREREGRKRAEQTLNGNNSHT